MSSKIKIWGYIWVHVCIFSVVQHMQICVIQTDKLINLSYKWILMNILYQTEMPHRMGLYFSVEISTDSKVW